LSKNRDLSAVVKDRYIHRQPLRRHLEIVRRACQVLILSDKPLRAKPNSHLLR
jgi:hypothetical protein